MNAALCDLDQFGTLRISGDDALSFLQNLLSNDMRAVDGQHAGFGSLNTPKGRMLATLLIWREGADYCVQLPRDLLAAIQKKLTLYVLRSKVKVTDASDEIVCLGLGGHDAAQLAAACFADVPKETMGVAQQETDTLIRLDTNRLQIVTTPARAAVLRQRLTDAGAQPADSRHWDWLTIRAGIPVVLPATQEAFVPQMANLELIGGVNFKKGCYPGQEIVARMHYLGKAKRRMYLAHVAADAKAGDELFNAEGENCGMVANAAPAPDGGMDLLVVIQIASLDAPVHLGSAAGDALQFLPMPYAIPD
ncbi:MAG: folate-binding protein [Gallionellaceae bacterium]|jgi:folate-binding protein YgfZ|nr:folate-binding protein [Gallionellaceae bacterium]